MPSQPGLLHTYAAEYFRRAYGLGCNKEGHEALTQELIAKTRCSKRAVYALLYGATYQNILAPLRAQVPGYAFSAPHALEKSAAEFQKPVSEKKAVVLQESNLQWVSAWTKEEKEPLAFPLERKADKWTLRISGMEISFPDSLFQATPPSFLMQWLEAKKSFVFKIGGLIILLPATLFQK